MSVILWLFCGLGILVLTGFAFAKWYTYWTDSKFRFDNDYSDTGIRVACVGDSITQGSESGSIKKYSYPAKLSKLLGNEYVVANFGVFGATAMKDGDKPYNDLKAYSYSKDFEPDIVLIMFGANDSKTINWNKEMYKIDFTSLIKSYIDLPSSPRVIAMITIPAFSTTYKIQPKVIKDEVVPCVMAICNELNIEYIDLNNLLDNKKELLIKDGIHPNKAGNEFIAEKIYNSVMWK